MSVINIIFYSFLSVCSLIHDHHVSITTLMLKEENQKLEMTLKLTAHDLEHYFEKEKKIELNLGHHKENVLANELITTYIKEHFVLKINNQLIHLEFIGKETENDESLWIYFESLIPKNIHSISINNQILTEIFDNQQNIVHLEGAINESFTFNKHFKKKIFNKGN